MKHIITAAFIAIAAPAIAAETGPGEPGYGGPGEPGGPSAPSGPGGPGMDLEDRKKPVASRCADKWDTDKCDRKDHDR